MVFQWFCYPLTITIECFFADWPLTSMVFQWFPKFRYDGERWFWSWKDPKKRVNVKYFTTNLRNLQNNLHAPFYPFHFSSIVLAYRIHDLNEDFAYILLRFKVGCRSRWTFKSSFCCHWKFAMFFRGTITIEWNGQRQPLKTMVFRWFWVSQPLVTMVFRWLATIGPTMEWLHTIVEVYLELSSRLRQICL